MHRAVDDARVQVQFPLAGIAADLHSSGHLPGARWRAIGACNSYGIHSHAPHTPKLCLFLLRRIVSISLWIQTLTYRRYNPLGNTSTFLNADDIDLAVRALSKSHLVDST
jgi:hypothetical protein